MNRNIAGYNPMRWDCKKHGCFNEKMRPKLEQFAHCFGGKNNFGDVDGRIEQNGYALELEWKGDCNIPTGQRIAFEHLTKANKMTVIIAVGDAETMTVRHMAIAGGGHINPFQKATLDDVFNFCQSWWEWVKRQKME